jgi:hypothetical protein
VVAGCFLGSCLRGMLMHPETWKAGWLVNTTRHYPRARARVVETHLTPCSLLWSSSARSVWKGGVQPYHPTLNLI